MRIFTRAKRVLVLATLVSSGLTVTAATPRSTSYEIEAASIAADGNISDEGVYSIVSQVKTSGFSQEITSSSNYQITPVALGSDDASVGMWMLY